MRVKFEVILDIRREETRGPREVEFVEVEPNVARQAARIIMIESLDRIIEEGWIFDPEDMEAITVHTYNVYQDEKFIKHDTYAERETL